MTKWTPQWHGSLLLTGVRLVGIGTPGTAHPVSVRVRDGIITDVGEDLVRRPGEAAVDGGGNWAMPGLWDHHVHLGQWALTRQRIDVSAARDAGEAARLIAAARPAPRDPWQVVQAFGHRPVLWPALPRAADLDAVLGDTPVVVVSGDAHHGWLSTSAYHVLGLAPRDGVLEEEDWWPVFARLSGLPGAQDLLEAGYAQVLDDAAAAGVVGIVDMEMDDGWQHWPARVHRGLDTLRIRSSVYRQSLAEVLAAGHRTGDDLGGSGLITMGPLKVISDGSLNTRTAYCCEPFADGAGLTHPSGVQNVTPQELTWLLGQAHGAGLEAAVHAIGDLALRQALDAFEATGCAGAVEHAQLVAAGDVGRMARLGVRASVQPAHLWDDRDVMDHCWPDRAERCFPLASMVAEGVTLRLGSDAPVSPLDPWLAMASAVHRSADERGPWQPEQALTVAQALAASTDGWGTLAPGHPGDIVLVGTDPTALQGDSAQQSAALLGIRPVATFVAGRQVA
ncbi:amidohydrolase [Dermacoccaceae bacterium W4C1]